MMVKWKSFAACATPAISLITLVMTAAATKKWG